MPSFTEGRCVRRVARHRYLMFTVGALPGYKDPANKAAADYWCSIMRRNCETLHYAGCLAALEALAATL